MSSRTLLLVPLTLTVAPMMIAQSANQPPPTPPPVARALPAPTQPAVPATTQRVYGPASNTLVTRDAAETVTGNFRKAYVKADAAPRIVVYVNRALVDTAPGAKDGAAPALADQQTVREIERLVGRAFRNAGAQLADQKTAAALLPDAGGKLVGDQAARDREALSKIADIAIEVLISSRNITVPQVSGDATYPVPDIQVTALRLKDSAIIGQAAASDILGKGLQAGRIVQQFDVRDITEATALALMEDMLTGTK